MSRVVDYVCTKAEARELTNAIADNLTITWALLADAYEGRAWSVLGYGSWSDYCLAEFNSIPLPKDERSAIIGALRLRGLSHNAIAAATGISNATVSRELSASTNVEAEEITGTDGKRYAPTRAPRPKVVEDANTICAEFIHALRNMVDLRANVPFDSVTEAGRRARAAELRSICEDLNQIIQLLEENPSD